MEKGDNSLTGILKIIQINPKFYFSSVFLAGGGLDEYVLGNTKMIISVNKHIFFVNFKNFKGEKLGHKLIYHYYSTNFAKCLVLFPTKKL
jgi:hypothetical protein